MSSSSNKRIKLDHNGKYSSPKLDSSNAIFQKISKSGKSRSKTETDILKDKVNDKIKAKIESINNYLLKVPNTGSIFIKKIISKYYDQPSSYETYFENDLHYDYMQFFSKDDAKHIFKYLEENIEYFPEEFQKVHIYGKWCPIKRKQVAFGEEGLTYTFSGITVPALPWDPVISSIRDLVSEIAGCSYNFVLINRYKDGGDKIGEHRDDEKDLDPDAPIASLSLGAERDFVFRHQDARRGRADIATVTLPLASGSLLVMRNPTNSIWYHSLPERRGVFTPRLNLTFRVMLVNNLVKSQIGLKKTELEEASVAT